MGERQRREQWVVDKTKEIKEQTVRGLEPDIQRLVGKQREEAQRLEAQIKEEARREVAAEQARSQRELAGRVFRAWWRCRRWIACIMKGPGCCSCVKPATMSSRPGLPQMGASGAEAPLANIWPSMESAVHSVCGCS